MVCCRCFRCACGVVFLVPIILHVYVLGFVLRLSHITQSSFPAVSWLLVIKILRLCCPTIKNVTSAERAPMLTLQDESS